MKAIEFQEPRHTRSGRTKIWPVAGMLPQNQGVVLGHIMWYSHWRRYVFHPEPFSFFDYECMREIAEFCDARTQEHKRALTRR